MSDLDPDVRKSPELGEGRRRVLAHRLVLLGAIAVNVVAAASVAAFLAHGRSQARAAAVVNTQNLTHLLDEGLSSAFDKVDLALLAVRDEVDRQAAGGREDGAALDALLAREKERAPDLLALRLIARDGKHQRSVPTTSEPIDLADRDYFVRLREGAETVVSRPLAGRIIKAPVIIFGRRLAGADGAFAGAIIGSLDLNHVSAMLSSPDVGPQGTIALRTEDMSLVAWSGPGGTPSERGQSVVSGPYQALLASGRTTGIYDAHSTTDGILRLHQFRRLDHHPFYVNVGLAHDDYLAAWRRQATLALLLLAGFLVLSTLGAWLTGRAQRDLRESEARLAAAFAAFPDALAISSYETSQYLLVNEGFTRATGWTVGEALGKTSADLELWIDRADRDAVVSALVTRGAVDDHEAAFRRRDGSHLTGLISGRVIMIEGKRFLLTITRDITRQRQLEAQVHQAQRLESVGRLAGGVAHDFNNMLAVILSEAAMLTEELTPDHPAQAGLREIIHAGERSRDLTRQLLAFSRKQVISPRVVNLNTLVEATRPTLARLIGEDIAMVFEPAQGLQSVRLDPGQFDQVLMNLVVNARDAMPQGGRLVLRTANVTLDGASGQESLPPGEYVLLTVADDGHGMGPETLAHIFEPFFTTKGPGRGTGLGLATAYGIVQQSGGAIRAASTVGQGSTFSIYLPSAGELAEPLPTAPRRTLARGRGTVLLVEDEAQVRSSTRRLLESLGYAVLEAAGGEDALELAHGSRFDVLITDVVMPGMKGTDLAQRLQALHPGTPTLFISGYAGGALDGHGPAEEGVRLLQKPFSREELAQKVLETLESGQRPILPA